MWWQDPHADHAALGQALRTRALAEPVLFGDVRWLVRPEQATAAGAAAYALPANLAPTIKAMSRHAGWVYRSWLPPSAYAIGYHSVANLYFDDVERADPNHHVKL
jgi:hypothetical protein